MASTFSLQNGFGTQINNIRFNSAKTRIEVYEISSGTVLDSFSIANYMGMHVDSNNDLIMDDGITRISTLITTSIANATIRVEKVSGVYFFIGITDEEVEFQAPGSNGINTRSDDPKMYFRT